MHTRPYVDRRVVDVDAARGVARQAASTWGLPAPTFLRHGMNVIFGCEDVVVRVGRATAPAAASHALGLTMARLGIPVAEPVAGAAIDVDGFAVTAWERLWPVDEPVDWRSVGEAVARLHQVDRSQLPSDYPVPSPATFPWWDFDEMLATVGPSIDAPALCGLKQAVDARSRWRSEIDVDAVVCHGDVHPGNVVMTDRGPVLIDFDLLCHAAPAWDHAMLTTYSDRWGGDPAVYGAFADGYGRSLAEDDLTTTLATLRNVAATLMRVRAGATDESARAESERRLRFWRGDPDAPTWRAQ